MNVIKLDGTVEAYDQSKLIQSLKNSGADARSVQRVIELVSKELFDGIETSRIYKRAFQILEELPIGKEVSFRYSLRRAVSEFGPSGFPFEKFVGEVFRLRGYSVKVGVNMKGRCVTHEMDVVGEKPDELMTAELKFHNNLKIKTDLKVALYVRARFDDLIAAGLYGNKKQRLMIITNTKFSSNAIKYANCADMELVGWNYPHRGKGNLHDMIQKSGIHPLTCLGSLTKKQKQYFLDEGMVLCSELVEDDARALHEASHVLPKSKVKKVMEEIRQICECV